MCIWKTVTNDLVASRDFVKGSERGGEFNQINKLRQNKFWANIIER